MQTDDVPAAVPADSRQDVMLDAAVAVFARYGFRKTSMEDVARAAGVSRQGLYLSFTNKEELFREALTHKLEKQLAAATAALKDAGGSLEVRLVTACDEWAGQHVGAMGLDAADLMCASTALAGGTLTRYEALFESALARAIDKSPLAKYCTEAGVSPAHAAKALHATASGLKQKSKSRQEFVQGMTAAARMFCAPLTPRSAHRG